MFIESLLLQRVPPSDGRQAAGSRQRPEHGDTRRDRPCWQLSPRQESNWLVSPAPPSKARLQAERRRVRHPVPVQQQERPLAPFLELARPLEPRFRPVQRRQQVQQLEPAHRLPLPANTDALSAASRSACRQATAGTRSRRESPDR